MKIEIHYCAQWDYKPEAVSLTAEIQGAIADAEVELFPEGKGIFDVVADGSLIFSKYKTDRFPETGEVTRSLQSLTSS